MTTQSLFVILLGPTGYQGTSELWEILLFSLTGSHRTGSSEICKPFSRRKTTTHRQTLLALSTPRDTSTCQGRELRAQQVPSCFHCSGPGARGPDAGSSQQGVVLRSCWRFLLSATRKRHRCVSRLCREAASNSPGRYTTPVGFRVAPPDSAVSSLQDLATGMGVSFFSFLKVS